MFCWFCISNTVLTEMFHWNSFQKASSPQSRQNITIKFQNRRRLQASYITTSQQRKQRKNVEPNPIDHPNQTDSKPPPNEPSIDYSTLVFPLSHGAFFLPPRRVRNPLKKIDMGTTGTPTNYYSLGKQPPPSSIGGLVESNSGQ